MIGPSTIGPENRWYVFSMQPEWLDKQRSSPESVHEETKAMVEGIPGVLVGRGQLLFSRADVFPVECR